MRGMGCRACSASSIPRSTGAPAAAQLSATLRGMLSHRRRCFSSSGSARHWRITSFQSIHCAPIHVLNAPFVRRLTTIKEAPPFERGKGFAAETTTPIQTLQRRRTDNFIGIVKRVYAATTSVTTPIHTNVDKSGDVALASAESTTQGLESPQRRPKPTAGGISRLALSTVLLSRNCRCQSSSPGTCDVLHLGDLSQAFASHAVMTWSDTAGAQVGPARRTATDHSSSTSCCANPARSRSTTSASSSGGPSTSTCGTWRRMSITSSRGSA